MSGTVLLFREDPDLDLCESVILEVRHDGSLCSLVLDRTLFYPEGGGQPGDMGCIAGFPVVSVTESAGAVVLHTLDVAQDSCLLAESLNGKPELPGRPGSCSILEPGNRVVCKLDRDRRLDFTIQHSAQHLVSATILSLGGGPTVSMHLGDGLCTIDVQMALPGRGFLDEVEAEVNRRIRLNLPVRIHSCPPEDPFSFPLRKRPPAGEDVIRIVDMGELDYSPCCGTHAGSTGQLGMVFLFSAEKYKGMTRMYFAAGERARRLASQRIKVLDSSAATLGVAPMDVAERSAVLLSKLKTVEGEAGAMRKRLAELWVLGNLARKAGFSDTPENPSVQIEETSREKVADPVSEITDPARTGGCTLYFLEPDGPASSAAFAQECIRCFAEAGQSAVIMSKPDCTVCISAPERFHGAARIAELGILARTEGGSGGGSRGLFRAKFANPALAKEFAEKARVVLSSPGTP